MSSYHTKQKDNILDIIKNKGMEFTVKDIYLELNEEIGLTTIYRCVDNLVDNHLINKVIGKNNITYYQYLGYCDKENHFYLKCNKCGVLIHVDCDCVKELYDHILDIHKFIPNKDDFIVNGICNKCRRI